MNTQSRACPHHAWIGSLRDRAGQLGMPSDAILLAVDAGRQVMWVSGPGVITAQFGVSTSRNGLGEEENSEKTPRGFHRIKERIGDGLAEGTVFVSREPVEPGAGTPGVDPIVARILWLEGMEDGLNRGRGRDSHERFIYIHGTADTRAVGRRPRSRGCIRMKPRDMIDLFEATDGCETWCWIGFACVD